MVVSIVREKYTRKYIVYYDAFMGDPVRVWVDLQEEEYMERDLDLELIGQVEVKRPYYKIGDRFKIGELSTSIKDFYHTEEGIDIVVSTPKITIDEASLDKAIQEALTDSDFEGLQVSRKTLDGNMVIIREAEKE